MNRGLKIIPPREDDESNVFERPKARPSKAKQPGYGRRLVRVREAAEYLGSSPWRVRQLIANRRIPFVQDGDGPFWLDIRDLDSFIERSKRVV